MQYRQSENVFKIMMVYFKPDLDYKIESDACLGDFMYAYLCNLNVSLHKRMHNKFDESASNGGI